MSTAFKVSVTTIVTYCNGREICLLDCILVILSFIVCIYYQWYILSSVFVCAKHCLEIVVVDSVQS